MLLFQVFQNQTFEPVPSKYFEHVHGLNAYRSNCSKSVNIDFVSICNCKIGEFQNLQDDLFGKNGVFGIQNIIHCTGYRIGFGTNGL